MALAWLSGVSGTVTSVDWLLLVTLEYYLRLSPIRTASEWESCELNFSESVEAASYRLFEMLPTMPRFTIEQVRIKLDTTFPTASAAVSILAQPQSRTLVCSKWVK